MSGLIPAHGLSFRVDASTLTGQSSLLRASLGLDDVHLQVSAITEVKSVFVADAFDRGLVTVTADKEIAIWFPPNSATEQELFVRTLSAAMNGDGPIPQPVPHLDFVAVDVETANSDWGSICQIGAAKVRDGHVVETKEWLCTPPGDLNSFDEANIAIHGITADMVATAPSFAECYDQFADFAGDLPLAAHNAQFDMTAFLRATQAADIRLRTTNFGCSLAAARAAHLPIANHKLPTVSQHLHVELRHHHNACADAEACAGILIALTQRLNTEITDFTSAFNMLGFHTGQLSDARVYPVLKVRGASSTPASPDSAAPAIQTPPAEKPRKATKAARAPWSKVATPETIPDPNPDADPQGRLFGQSVTLSGDFAPYDKGELWAGIANQGGIIGKNVTKKTTILVCGPWDKPTSKQKRAEELRAKGQVVDLWTQEDLFAQLGLNPEDEQPPF
ncbi:DNA polymerase III subunit epsilon [Corynebacterium diphtheriae bv. gravis]|uniref:exonuclease domain-containing protein n=1 Tax=Corynebacterium diphtheriae TaxID=1717 RepID=UPI000B4B67D5|nr:exonuclease domain-containing protein [Corynebacterium diphtheriae]OWN37614.1 DNA polymerase III subunit epsilon [Corynebacterium diphtheriae bv. gravis]OWN68629.1 DNA polymerase III subunit epsilon [Corynebacterium diphtheriae bv. gravis]OWO23658.1 DNA polymerase III subunit epsilon [Corynebacterium diphtheriae bv. gravis]OWO50853.1 DNA polymerase III subunit epsilon [Corynebacterium diphtheriae bv. gravis]CAB1041186.1 DNA polymerase III subunit epsilon [Corynebacterium diphtheriae]